MPDFHDCGRTPWLETRSAAVVRDMAPYVIAGLLLRLLWLNTATGTLVYVQADEAARVALSVARGGGLADAFPGTGPTAHLLPTMPRRSCGRLPARRAAPHAVFA